MTNVNHVILQGNLTKDASDGMRQSGNGTSYGSFTIAVSKSVKGADGKWENKTSFIECKGFGKSYENAVKHMTKGSSVTVEGILEQQTWEKEGQKMSKVVVIADKYYPTYKKDSGNNPGKAQNSAPKTDEFPEDLPF